MSIEREIAALHRLTTKQLKRRFAELTGDATQANNRPWLLKRIAWRLQVKEHGGLSEKALARAEELADPAELRHMPPREQATPTQATPPAPKPAPVPADDNRLPPPGSHIVRKYKGREVRVLVLAAGFQWEGRRYASLSSVANAVTGSHCNGFLFFKLNRGEA